MDCSAKGEGWACDRPARAHGLCVTHYRQKNRGNPLTEIGSHLLGESVRISALIDSADVEAAEAEAQRRGVTTSTVYREAIHEHVSKFKKAGR